MNRNKMLDMVKSRLGLHGIIQDTFEDRELIKLIDTSLMEFNVYSTFTLKGSYNDLVNTSQPLVNLNVVDGSSRYTYAISPKVKYVINKYHVDIVSVSAVRVKGSNTMSSATVKSSFPSSRTDMLRAAASAQRNANVNSTFLNCVMSGREHVIMDSFSIINSAFNDVSMSFRIQHPRSLYTIKGKLERIFTDLVTANVAEHLLTNYLVYLQTEIGQGRVEIPMNVYEEWKSRKIEILAELEKRTDVDSMTMFLL